MRRIFAQYFETISLLAVFCFTQPYYCDKKMVFEMLYDCLFTLIGQENKKKQ